METDGSLSPEVLTSLAKQIGSILPGFLDPIDINNPPKIELADSFLVWVLTKKNIDSMKELQEITRKTNIWHHQILVNGQPIAFARSTPKTDSTESTDRVISELYYPASNKTSRSLAEQIAESIKYVNSIVTQDVVADILIFPAYQLYALWLIDWSKEKDKDQIVVINCPSSFASCLQPNKLMSAKVFIENIRKEQYIEGIICD